MDDMSHHLRKKDGKKMQNRKREMKSKQTRIKHSVTRDHLLHREHPVQPVVPVTSTGRARLALTCLDAFIHPPIQHESNQRR